MDKKVTGIVAYITIIGWLIAYLAGDKEGAKFHLNQALVLAIVNLILNVASTLLSGVLLIGLVLSICGIVTFVFMIMGIVYAAKEENKELPIIGKIQILK